MLINDEILENFPFPEMRRKPTKLTIKLQERIKYMFGITVEPVIIRQPESYKKTEDFRYLWKMKTICGKYCIACHETAIKMSERKAWHVMDSKIFYDPFDQSITKFIY